MKAFRLVGSAQPFALERTIMSAGCIPGVVGISQDGKRAIAAEADIIWLDDFRFKPALAPDALGRYSIHDCDRDDIIDRAATWSEAEKIALLMNIRTLLAEGGRK